MRKKIIFLLILIYLNSSNSPANSIENGENAPGAPVVGLIASGSYSIFCSGAMIAPRIVVSAHHCIPTAGEEIDLLSKFTIQISYPGASIDQNTQFAKVLETVSKNVRWKLGDCQNGFCEDLDDLIFLIIDRDFPVPSNLRVAKTEDLELFRSINEKVVTFGYGLTRPGGRTQEVPNKLFAKLDAPNPGGFGSLSFNILVEEDKNICAGDSGGPTYALHKDYLYYIGPTSSTRRPSCVKDPITDTGYYGGTAVAFKYDLYEKALLRAQVLREQQDAKEKEDAEQKALIEMKAKQEADAKAAAGLKAMQDAQAKAAALKKTTITCVKGKLIKKITAIKPKCPSGYTLKK